MNDSIHGGLRVCQSTPLVQLQDRGRFGCRHLGVTQGGALDWLSMGWANWLLGNPLDAAVIEIALGGFVADCRADGWLALAGGDLGATLDGQPLPARALPSATASAGWPMARDRARCPCPANGSWTAPAKRAWS